MLVAFVAIKSGQFKNMQNVAKWTVIYFINLFY